MIPKTFNHTKMDNLRMPYFFVFSKYFPQNWLINCVSLNHFNSVCCLFLWLLLFGSPHFSTSRKFSHRQLHRCPFSFSFIYVMKKRVVDSPCGTRTIDHPVLYFYMKALSFLQMFKILMHYKSIIKNHL